MMIARLARQRIGIAAKRSRSEGKRFFKAA
jgi:hypothetical protein